MSFIHDFLLAMSSVLNTSSLWGGVEGRSKRGLSYFQHELFHRVINRKVTLATNWLFVCLFSLLVTFFFPFRRVHLKSWDIEKNLDIAKFRKMKAKKWQSLNIFLCPQFFLCFFRIHRKMSIFFQNPKLSVFNFSHVSLFFLGDMSFNPIKCGQKLIV